MSEQNDSVRTKSTLRFLVPSLLGVACFLTPIRYEGGYTILIGVMTDLANEQLGDLRIPLLIAILTVSAVVTPSGELGTREFGRQGFYLAPPDRCGYALGTAENIGGDQRLADLPGNWPRVDLA